MIPNAYLILETINTESKMLLVFFIEQFNQLHSTFGPLGIAFWNQLALRNRPSTSSKGPCLCCNDLVPFRTKSFAYVAVLGKAMLQHH